MFVYQGNPADNTFSGWSARVGQRISSGASSGYTVYSTCAASNCTNIIGHNNITSSSLNTGSDAGINCCSHGNLWDAAQDHRFMIITSSNAGTDELTINGSNGMSRIPSGYTSCIRLGDPRASYDGAAYGFTWNSNNANKSSEALFYTLNVTPLNALLIINYAVVGRCYDHTPDQAGEFLIRVVKQNDDGTWPNEPINDSMWFRISAPPIPASGTPNAPWMMGRPGNACASTTCAYVYKPWAKVAISLSKYLYQKVRVEMYTSDCVPTVDPIYAYICGDYQPMRINSTGCADANSSAVDTLHAPEGLSQYKWYVSTTGPDEDIYNAPHMDSIVFRELTDTSSSNIYVPTLADFVLTEGPHAGDTVATQTFMCTMVSALDPDKPFTSKVYGNVSNGKPTPMFVTSSDCNLNISFSNTSITYNDNEIDPDSTRWIVYADTLGTAILDTLWGDTASYHFPTDGYYKVSMRVKVANKDCGSITSQVCHALAVHEIPITLSEDVVCEGEIVAASCSEFCHLNKIWHIGDSLTYTSDDQHSYDTIVWTPTVGITTVTLTTNTDGLCEGTSTTTVKCIGNATITSDVDVSLICRGDSVTLSALGVENPRWISMPYDSILGDGDGRNIVTVTPQVTTTYSAEPSGDSRCVQNASEITIIVFPYPQPTIWTSKSYVDITDPILTIEDHSPYSTSSHWNFSDGLTAEGKRLEHRFGAMDDSVTIALHACNEERCCRDTSITLPVQINALWIPNTFTPGQSTNSHFRFISTIPILEFEIWVYNRNGMLVYHGNDYEQGWDGRSTDGDPCPQGAYAYFYRYTLTSEPASPHTGTGTVTLLR